MTETGELLSAEPADTLESKLEIPSFPDPAAYTCRDITLTYYDRARESSDPTFTQENLRTRVSWTAMVERDAVDTVFTLYSYDPHEGRALGKCPVDIFREEPGCRGG